MTNFLKSTFAIEYFSDLASIPPADIVIFLKFLPTAPVLAKVGMQSRVIFMPVDIYGSCREIDENAELLEHVARTIVHSRRLQRYFAAYCDVDYLDHPINFVLDLPRRTDDSGPLIWIGQHCNLSPVIDWLNADESAREVWILTNINDDLNTLDITNRLMRPRVRIEQWTRAKHIQYLALSTAAIDIKGDDFRARHKPPAKSFDFAASGIPIIVGHGSSADYHFRHIGYTPLYANSWQEELDGDYRQYAYKKAMPIRQSLSSESVWNRLRMMLEEEFERVPG